MTTSNQSPRPASKQTPVFTHPIYRHPSLLCIQVFVGIGVAIAPLLLPTLSIAQSNQSDVTGIVGGLEIQYNVTNPEDGSGGGSRPPTCNSIDGTRRFALNPPQVNLNLPSTCEAAIINTGETNLPSNNTTPSTEDIASGGAGGGTDKRNFTILW